MSGAADDRKVTSIVVSPYAAASRPGARIRLRAAALTLSHARDRRAVFVNRPVIRRERAQRAVGFGPRHAVRADGAKPVSILYHDVMYSRLRVPVETFSYKRRNSGYAG
ncbi:hypothetical protein [Burkholderia multivorans]|uniref:hypothetical protein n=1 Tax=Burkholderia multivorans TaxID=87883 RepID=UPI0021BE55AE|nr:hypothetical protein [Burkholderia multivorans]